ncbi:single-stranded DNA-binding protein [Nonomuraea sp. NPDC050663]|uniref:single-stranded DNA-binding protein n=1 Tax=Nonomuraea sp. NPDC050663 TaxID=3364370 RepID=UPI0037ADEB96
MIHLAPMRLTTDQVLAIAAASAPNDGDQTIEPLAVTAVDDLKVVLRLAQDTLAGTAVARIRVASNPRFFDRATNDWKDGDSLFLTCNIWRDQGENAAETVIMQSSLN